MTEPSPTLTQGGLVSCRQGSRAMVGFKAFILSFIAALAVSAALGAPSHAGTVFGAETIALPCLAASTDFTGFRSAFLADGWIEPTGPDLVTASHALGEIIYWTTRMPPVVTPEDYARFVEGAHAHIDKHDDDMLIMQRDGVSVGITVRERDGTYTVSCVVTGATIPSVPFAMLQADAHMDTSGKTGFAVIGFYAEKLELPGFERLRYDWIFLEPPKKADPPLLARNSILVSYGFRPENPPAPPKATNP